MVKSKANERSGTVLHGINKETHKRLLALNIDDLTFNVNYRKFQVSYGSRELWLSYIYLNLKKKIMHGTKCKPVFSK